MLPTPLSILHQSDTFRIWVYGDRIVYSVFSGCRYLDNSRYRAGCSVFALDTKTQINSREENVFTQRDVGKWYNNEHRRYYFVAPIFNVFGCHWPWTNHCLVLQLHFWPRPSLTRIPQYIHIPSIFLLVPMEAINWWIIVPLVIVLSLVFTPLVIIIYKKKRQPSADDQLTFVPQVAVYSVWFWQSVLEPSRR